MTSLRKTQFENLWSPPSNNTLLVLGVFVLGWTIFVAGAQASGQSVAHQNYGSIDGVVVPQRASQPNQPKVDSQQPQVRALQSKIRIVVETNRVLVIGSKEDVKTVVAAIEVIRQKMMDNSDPTIRERVVLKFQLAETVTSIMSTMMEMHSTGAAVKISPLHFPEAVLIVGPTSSVRHAKKLLAAIDSHDGFPKSKKPTASKPTGDVD